MHHNTTVARWFGPSPVPSLTALEDRFDALTLVPDGTITIDLRGVRCIDACGLRSIFLGQARAQDLACWFFLVRGAAEIQRVFAPSSTVCGSSTATAGPPTPPSTASVVIYPM